MTKIQHNYEAEVERRLIEVLGEGHNQWNYRPDLKSEDDLWVNLRQKITQNNLSEIGEHPITDGEFECIKTELLQQTRTPFYAARWLKGENGISRITIDREDISLGQVSLIIYSNQHIGGGISTYEVVHQIAKRKLESDSHNRRFDVTLLIKNGRPQKSAIITTSSIEMAKRYYYAIKKMTSDKDWMIKEFKNHPIRKGRSMEDPDFPRIAITYSMQENEENASMIQEEVIYDFAGTWFVSADELHSSAMQYVTGTEQIPNI